MMSKRECAGHDDLKFTEIVTDLNPLRTTHDTCSSLSHGSDQYFTAFSMS